MRIYTKNGDNDTTSLMNGNRVLKSDKHIEAYGTIDELICYLGLIKDMIEQKKNQDFLFLIQNKLMICAAIIANTNNSPIRSIPELNEDDIFKLENEIDNIEKEVKPLHSFIIPGGHVLVSHIHIARCICRRAERNCVKAAETNSENLAVIKYLNRLSDYLFMLARLLAKMLNIDEINWNKNL